MSGMARNATVALMIIQHGDRRGQHDPKLTKATRSPRKDTASLRWKKGNRALVLSEKTYHEIELRPFSDQFLDILFPCRRVTSLVKNGVDVLDVVEGRAEEKCPHPYGHNQLEKGMEF